jgi:hypothetical protein
MADDRYEPNRVLGFPIRADRPGRQRGDGRPDGPRPEGQREEPQRVMGFPVDSFGPVDLDWLRPLAHPIREYRRWARRRRLGPYAVDDDEPGPPR